MRMRALDQQVDAEWRLLLMNAELSQHYPRFSRFHGMRFEFFDRVLISTFYINAVSFLDQQLQVIADEQGIRPRKPTLYERIEALDQAGLLLGAVDLHRAREQRNILGHEMEHGVKWTDLHAAFQTIGRDLAHLGTVAATPEYEYRAELGAYGGSPDPEVGMESQNYIGVARKDTGALEMSVHWRSRIFKSGGSDS